jgi:hypothetical protein
VDWSRADRDRGEAAGRDCSKKATSGLSLGNALWRSVDGVAGLGQLPMGQAQQER